MTDEYNRDELGRFASEGGGRVVDFNKKSTMMRFEGAESAKVVAEKIRTKLNLKVVERDSDLFVHNTPHAAGVKDLKGGKAGKFMNTNALNVMHAKAKSGVPRVDVRVALAAAKAHRASNFSPMTAKEKTRLAAIKLFKARNALK